MKIKVIDRVISTALLVAVLTVIFILSAQNSHESDGVSGGFIKTLASVFKPDFGTLTEAQQLKIVEAWQSVVRTLGHFSEYGALGFFAANAARSYGLKGLWGILAPFAFSVVYALSDEIHQIFVPGRTCELKDLLVDSLGSLLGVLLFSLVMWIILKEKRKSRPNNSDCRT